ncbi:hypothetical protein Tco_0277166 [Tanacetum coccineum]
MEPKRTTRSSLVTTTTTTTPMTDAQLKALIDQGIVDALAARDVDRNRNGEDSHDSRMGTVGHDVAYAMTWTNLKKKMTDKYCPRGEIKKLKGEMWNLKVNRRSRCGADNKRKFDDTSKNNQNQQQQNKRQNTDMAYTTGSGEKKPYGGVGHLAYNYRSTANVNTANNQSDTRVGGNGNAPAKVYAVGIAWNKPRLKRVTELDSFEVIIDMDWLEKYQAVIVYAEKIVRIPWGNKTLIVQGDGSNRGNQTLLNIISCTKTHKYMLKGCHVFLAHVTTKETEDKSEEKRLKDVPIV